MLRIVIVVRALIATVLLAACAGPIRPAVIPKLSELPAEPERRNAILDSSHAEPGPEQKQGKTTRQKQVETAAATAAAWIGVLFSTSGNVTMGAAAPVDENLLFEPPPQKKREQKAAEGASEEGEDVDAKRPAPDAPAGPLVPWVRLK